jgi:hypothetical protein
MDNATLSEGTADVDPGGVKRHFCTLSPFHVSQA